MLDSEEITETNFDDSFEGFVSIIQHTIDKHAPLKHMSRKQKKIKRKPWITRNIYQIICLKNKMHRTHYIKGDAAMKLKYKKFSNKLTKIKTNAKEKYFAEELEKSKSNPRKTWEFLRSLIPSTTSNSNNNLPSQIIVNNCKITDKQKILNEFNEFFSTIGERAMAENFDSNDSGFAHFLRNKVKSSIYFDPPRINEVINLINSLNLSKGVGHDNIAPYFLRVASNILAPALCYFFDNAVQFGVFPRNCKIAKIIPLFKAGKKEEVNNYRPTSILTCLSKIFEKLIYTCLVSFFQKHSVIAETQYGFQNNKSTVLLMLY